jgi:hypothetical protein
MLIFAIMKRLLFLLTMAFPFAVQGQERTINVKVTNQWVSHKTDEPVVVKLDEVKRLKFDVRSAMVRLDGREIPCQLDDMNGDSRADELIFLADIDGGQMLEYEVTLSATRKQNDYAPRVYADMMLDDKKGKHPFITSIEAPGNSYIYSDLYHHGAAFESELTAFRVYFDHRQNIDIYGKKLRRLELNDTHFYTTPKQMQQDYGNDVLWAGSSIGCGSLKLWDGTAPQNWEQVTTRGQRIVSKGPLRTVVEVKDMGVGADELNVRQLYILYAGHRECEVQVDFSRPLNVERFCTGVQKVGASPEGWVRPGGIAASWGGDYPEMGKKEVFPPETVGLAVYVPSEYVAEQRTDSLNYLFVVGKQGVSSMKYYISFCADKEAEGVFHTTKDWFRSLDAWKSSLQHPAKVRY